MLPSILFSFESDTLVGWKASIGGGAVLTNHTASFTTLNPCKTCAVIDNVNFTNSGGNGFFISAILSSRLNKMLRLDLGIDYFSTGVEFQNRKFWTNADNKNGGLDKLYLNYSMKPYLDYLNFSLGPTIVIMENLNLGFHLNASSLIKSTVDYSEKLDENLNYSFSDGTKVYASQENVDLLEMNSLLLGFTPSISYDLYINKRFAISPKLSYTLGFSDLQSGTNWKMSTFNLSINATIALSDILINSGENIPDCPPGMKRDKYMNCIPIECPEGMILNHLGICDCPEGYFRLGEICEKIKTKDDNIVNKNCERNFYFSETTQKCEPIIPIHNKDCKGAYLAIQTNVENEAEEILYILNQQGYSNFEIEKSKDVNDGSKKLYKVRTSCYPSSGDAYKAKIELIKLLESFQNDSLSKDVQIYN